MTKTETKARIRVEANVSKTRKQKISRIAKKYGITQNEALNRMLSHALKNETSIFS